jgi:hypothetical protein
MRDDPALRLGHRAGRSRAARAESPLIGLSCLLMPNQSVTFQPGDELRVDRGLYGHHGIYVGNDWVVQFGGRIKDKPHASIHCLPLTEFAKAGQPKVVEHQELDRAQAVRRTLWLLEDPPPMQYHMFGYNCEHVARWCATGRIECSQARSALTLNLLSGGGLLLLEHPVGWMLSLLQLIVGLFLAWLSRAPTRHFERHIRDNFPG